jgi:hypothetical protein
MSWPGHQMRGANTRLHIAAPRFRDAGITVVWRRMLRANDRYFSYAGPKTLTIEAIKAIPPFKRRFSWSE